MARRPLPGAGSDGTGGRVGATRLTVRAWALLVASLGCFIAGYAAARVELLYVASFAAALPIGALLYTRARRPRLSVDRRFLPPVVAVGQAAHVILRLRNTAPAPTTSARWRDLMPWPPYGTPPTRLGAIGAGRFAEASYELRPPRRGVVQVGPLTLDYGDPFGLVSSWRSATGTEALTVVPRITPLSASGTTVVEGDGAAQLVQRRASGNDDDLMTREYRAGDAMRRVHWRASARHGELMVRQEEQRSYPEARILIDTLRSGYDDAVVEPDPGQVESERFEWVVSMLASLGSHLAAEGYRVQLLESGPAQLLPPGDSREWAARTGDFLEGLARVRLCEPDAAAPVPLPPVEVHGPLFALLADATGQTVDWVVRQRRPHDNAVAFVLAGHGTPALERLAAAGWLCVMVQPDDDPAAAWTAAREQTGLAHGLA